MKTSIVGNTSEKDKGFASFFQSVQGMLFLLLIIVLVPIIIAQLLVYRDRLNTATKDRIQSNTEIARSTGKAFENFVQDIILREKGIALALSSVYMLEYSKFQSYLSQIEELYPDVERILIISPAGRVIAASKKSSVGMDVTERSYFREIMGGKEWAVSELLRTKSDGRPVFVVSSPIPGESGARIGVIAVAVDDKRLKDILGFARFGGDVTILDRTGRIVYRYPVTVLDWNRRDFTKIDPRVKNALSGEEVSGISNNTFDGKLRISAMCPIHSIGWVSRASIPETDALSDVYDQIYRNAAFFFLVAIVSIFAAILFSRRISNPIGKLKRQAQSLQGDEWSHPIVVSGPKEIEDFAASFNAMAGEIRMREEGLRKARDELDWKVKERTAELEKANKEMKEFVFVASHDLQEPVRKVQMFSDLLKNDQGDLSEEQRRDYFDRMLFAATRIRTMIDDLLAYSRVTARRQAFVKVDLSNPVGKVLQILDLLVEETQARIKVGGLPTVEADPSQMTQLFQNLLENALKFRSKDKPPEIKIYSELVGNDRVRIKVEDNGIGFDEKNLEKIFAPFERLHGAGKFKGTGMGLAICRKVVELHGGTITAKSSPNHGSTFIIDLPVKQSHRDTLE